jgi:mannose/fructose/N-acetylgalactosamine-specific phosphotransferase system component IIC
MGQSLTRMFWVGLCFGAGAVLLLLHVAASAVSAVALAEWLRVGLGLVGLALLVVGHGLRLRLLADRRRDAELGRVSSP